MYFSGKILPSKEVNNDTFDIATEASSVNHQMKEEWTLRDKYFPHVESFLPRTEHLLFKHIAKYEDKNATLLNSPYPILASDPISFKVCIIQDKKLDEFMVKSTN